MAKSKLQFLKFSNDIWDPSHRFETSWLFPPMVLFGIRALISLYAFTTLIFIIIRYLVQGHVGTARLQFCFLTVLCYWGLAFYFLAAATHTFTYALNGGTPLLHRLLRPLRAAHSLFHTTITVYPLLVTVVFWAVLFDGFDSIYSIWSNISEHALNAAFALFEIAFTRINPAPWIHLWWLIVILALYLSLAYLTHYTKGVYVYRFLNPAEKVLDGHGINVGGVGKFVGAYVMGIMAGVCVVFCVVKILVWLRKWATETKMGWEGKFFAGRDLGCGDVELEARRFGDKPFGA